ncbi:LacI family DNA-binding transcriptional regulator [Parendozoicomonas haliclonae]|uniref:HTH-type transcriptional regulator GalR n=1 Tax=Parendozoicomonas haliclonae TaxID=1960125 RepID=A0A1X7AP40_9GAMM|nr:LacI family DNA-binding transcriptional regulator [Parendozoicomonas haliclonae]SMA49913.1 HTH-type transcriptional regulator GalR [Parendozoicomonas haliclonae]
MASIKDVAELAGVSKATVSRVLNNTGQIREGTRARVHKAMEKLNYRPSPLAKSLATSSSNTVGLVVTSYRGHFYSELMAEVQEEMEVQGKFLLVSRGKRSRSSEQEAIQRLTDMCCDGLILHTRNMFDEDLVDLSKGSTPFVVLDRSVKDLEDRSIVYDHTLAGKMAVEHLLEKGHRKIACIAGPRSRMTAALRFDGYVQALESYGISVDESLVAEADYDRLGGYRAMKDILERQPDITAVYSCSEEMTVGAFDLFRERGINLPGDISIISFDSVSLCTMLTPQVSTVHFPIKEMAAESARVLTALMHGEQDVQPQRFIPELRLRDSVREI